MDRRSLVATGAISLGAAALGFAIFAPVNDEELIAQLLDDLGAALSFSEPIGNVMFFGSHLSEKFSEIFSEQVDIQVSEIQTTIPSHRGQLGIAAARALQAYGTLSISFAISNLEVTGERANAETVATLTATGGAGLRRDTRRVDFTFAKGSGDWRVLSAIVGTSQ